MIKTQQTLKILLQLSLKKSVKPYYNTPSHFSHLLIFSSNYKDYFLFTIAPISIGKIGEITLKSVIKQIAPINTGKIEMRFDKRTRIHLLHL